MSDFCRLVLSVAIPNNGSMGIALLHLRGPTHPTQGAPHD